MRTSRWRVVAIVGILAWVLFARGAPAQQPDSIPEKSLKQLTLEELMDVRVMSVSRRSERLSEVASAIQVITGDDIRHSGATSLPEALRLAMNLQVAQANASQWAISARGFTNVLANKLLVLIDGRTVYTPLYAGVFWDAHNTPLEDVDRIEVISGPGGAQWGANAVNGVLNVITKNAGETQGLVAEGGAGTELLGFGGLRYGGTLSPALSYRAYGRAFSRGSTLRGDSTAAGYGTDALDEWKAGQGGFRIDWESSADNRVTVQGDYYDGRPNPDGGMGVVARGGNAVARWTRTLSEGSDFQLQLYYDRSWRDFRNAFIEDLATYDLDWQHRFQLGGRHEVVWGLGTRLMDHRTENLALFRFLPDRKLLHLYTGFVQNEIALVPNRLRLALGTKLEHNGYTGYEIQPGSRLTWTPSDRYTMWGAISRGVRTPSRLDRDFSLLLKPSITVIQGANFQSEEVLALELGWRVQAQTGLSLSLSTFYNQYDNLRSVEPGPPPLGLPITFANGVEGHTYGAEFATVWQPATQWRLRGGYTFVKKDLVVKPGSADANRASAESNDAEHQLLVQSSLDLPGGLAWGVVGRWVGELPRPIVPAYVGVDTRVSWALNRYLEVSVVGQNLLESRHREFVPSSPSPRLIERAVYGKLTVRL